MALLYGYRRMLAVVGIAFFIYLLSPWGGESGRTIGDLTGFGNKSPPLTLDDLPKLEHNAHRLADADDFLPHFKAVAMLPGMPIAESKSGCNWFDEKAINFQFEDKEWMKKEREDTELEERRFQWHHFLDREMKPWSKYKSKFEGRGIVIVAGHKGSMDRVGVILRSLFKLGSQLPVEIHSFKGEIDKATKKNLTAMWPHMFFNDLSSKSAVIKTNLDNMFHVNYQLKTAAIVNSRFAEPLLLDSDNIPVVDPLTLYDTAEYREYGTLFWPDIARTRPNNPMWAITNTKCRMNEYEQESGQLIVDKRKFWYHLQLAAWFNNKEGGYYNDFLLGDKDMFRFAWHALKTQYGSPKKWFIPVGTVKDGVFCGHTFAQNHPDGRVAFMHGSLIKALTPPVIKYHKQHGGGIHQFYKRSLFDESHNVIEKAGVKWEDITYIPDRDPKMENVWCIDFFNVTAQPMDELIPGFEKTFEDIGGYWMLDA